jgi:hypothetical protein
MAKIIALCLPLILGGCGSGAYDCDPAPREYSVTHYKGQVLGYNSELRKGMADISNKPVSANEQIEWKKMAISLKADAQFYNVQIPAISLFPMANACSPSLGNARQTLTKISITSANDFNNQYPAGTELAELFTALDFAFVSLTDMTGVGLPAPLALRIFLREAPREGVHNFSVTLNLSDAREFQFVTGNLYLK